MYLEPFKFVLERVRQLLVDEVVFLSTDKKKHLRSLQQQLELAQSFVRDVEEEKEKARISHVLETEIQHIMQILPEIEEYLDTIHLEDAQQSHLQSFSRKMEAFFSSTNPFIRANLYQWQSNIPQDTRRMRRPTQPDIINEDFIVGLAEDVEALVAKLLGKEVAILAAVGMGGSGKTTLIRKIYNHGEIQRQFRNKAWICVSKNWDASQLLLQMCLQLHILAESEASLAGFRLREFLKNRSCLVAIDDVWEIAALQELIPFISSGGCMVLLTTRNEHILRYPVQRRVYIHKARLLTPEQSWVLFSKIVQHQWHGIRCFDAESLFAKPGKEMLKKCRGLPLAIVALAELLSTKRSIQEWEYMKKNITTRIMTQNKGSLDYGPVKDMLELSYSDLPYDLKPCFLYLGIYPEDTEIDVEDLIQLWIGEGFLRADMCFEGQILEERGTDIVDELVQRCMVQVASMDYEEKAQKIQVHDLMRDLCIEKARESGFFEIASPSTMSSSTIDTMSRRAIIHYARHSYLVNSPRLRSLIFMRAEKFELVSGSTNLLRVLVLEGIELDNIFNFHIENLILLRHLSIRECTGVSRPVLRQIKKLKNLLTLKCQGRGRIPDDMVGGMEHLRCLSLCRYRGPAVLGVVSSKSLQSLELQGGMWLCKELQAPNLIYSLRKLKLRGISLQPELDAVSDFLGTPSNHLHVLHLSMRLGWEVDMKRMKLECCSQLKSLYLAGASIRSQEVPLLFPPNLLQLKLDCVMIEEGEDLERALAELSQLRSLELHDSYDGDRLTMAGLPQLQELKLSHMCNLKEWIIEQGALCQLKDLHLIKCSRLERIPEGISSIHTLQCLSVNYMPLSFCERLIKPSAEGSFSFIPTGEDFHLISHIPTTKILHIVYPENVQENRAESDEEGEDRGVCD